MKNLLAIFFVFVGKDSFDGKMTDGSLHPKSSTLEVKQSSLLQAMSIVFAT